MQISDIFIIISRLNVTFPHKHLTIVFSCWIQPLVSGKVFKITLALWVHTTAATALNSFSVSIDHFMAIRFPFRYQDIFTREDALQSLFRCGLSHRVSLC